MTYKLIASTTLSSAAATVTFSGIPSTYTDLVLRLSIRGSGGFSVATTFNGDTASNYSYRTLYGFSTTAGSLGSANSTSLIIQDANYPGTTADTFTSAEYYFANYASTANKASSLFSVKENNATSNNWMEATAGLYRSSSAISSITLTGVSSNNFVSGSTFDLYGIE